jgi:hypothetical protein
MYKQVLSNSGLNMHLKKNLNILLITICFYTLSSSVCSASTLLDDIQRLLDVNESDAKKLLRSVGVVIRNVEHGISTIADSDHEYSDKIGSNGLINGVIKDNFSSEWATIYVSSLHRQTLSEYSVKSYLRNLALLSQNGKYHNVKIYFDKDMIVSNISKKNNETKMNVDVFQLFKGCKKYEGTMKCYTDVTKKTFVIKIEESSGNIGRSRIYIDSLGVKDTMTYDEGKDIVDSFKKY